MCSVNVLLLLFLTLLNLCAMIRLPLLCLCCALSLLCFRVMDASVYGECCHPVWLRKFLLYLGSLKKKCWHKQTCFKLKSKQTKHRWLVKGCIVYAKRYPSGKDLKVYWYCWVFGLFVRLCHVVRMCIVVVLFVHMMFLSPAVSIVHRVGFSLNGRSISGR